jgi:hypothetical protein
MSPFFKPPPGIIFAEKVHIFSDRGGFYKAAKDLRAKIFVDFHKVFLLYDFSGPGRYCS